MLFEVAAAFLDIIPTLITDKAEVTLILNELLLGLPLSGKHGEYNTGHNIPKEQPKERDVDQIVDGPPRLELPRRLRNHTRDIEIHDAARDARAALLAGLAVDVGDVVAEGHRAEDEFEGDAHQGHQADRGEGRGDRCEDVFQHVDH